MAVNEQMDEDFEWYREHLLDLYRMYGRCYVAIKNKTVLGTYRSFSEARRRTNEYQQPGTYIVQKVDRDDSAYTAVVPLVW